MVCTWGIYPIWYFGMLVYQDYMNIFPQKSSSNIANYIRKEILAGFVLSAG
jgi:hypothetical protein